MSADKQSIHIAGGCDYRGRVQSFSFTATNFSPVIWERTQDMTLPRFGFQLVPIYDSIFAIGGYCSDDKVGSTVVKTLSSTEKFNLKTCEWLEVRSMYTPRAFFASCPIRD